MKNQSKITLSIPRRHKDKRFDAALFALLEKEYPEKAFSRGFAAKLIRDGFALLNDRQVKPSVAVGQTDEISLDTEALLQEVPALLPNPDIHPGILFENDFFLAIDKPAGLQVHPTEKNETNTLANWIIATHPDTASVGENPLRPGIVHRLDRETSGIIVIAKTPESFLELKKAFHDHLAEKTYVALVFGHLAELSGIIDKPLGQRSGDLKRKVSDHHSPIKNARPAITAYCVIARYPDCDLVILTPKTGRTHQIRVHMAALGHPVIGDKLYASKPMHQSKNLSSNRHLLHAWRLELPVFGKKYAFQAPLPDDFRTILSRIDPDTYFDADSYRSIITNR